MSLTSFAHYECMVTMYMITRAFKSQAILICSVGRQLFRSWIVVLKRGWRVLILRRICKLNGAVLVTLKLIDETRDNRSSNKPAQLVRRDREKSFSLPRRAFCGYFASGFSVLQRDIFPGAPASTQFRVTRADITFLSRTD